MIFRLMQIPLLKKIYIIFTYICSIIPDDLYLKLIFRIRTGKKLNLNNPKTFNEKLQWLKLYNHNESYSVMVDKYQVRKYIADKIGEKYLIPLLGVYDNANDIDVTKLPDEFVIKCTHDSGSVVLCKKRQDLTPTIRKKLNQALKRKYFYAGREYPYKYVRPRIVIEKMMHNSEGNGLIDYKLHCFNGKTKLILVCLDREDANSMKKIFYDESWNKLNLKRPNVSNDYHIPRPQNLDEMIKLAETLSSDIPFVRIDFYEINGKTYFGEITFFPGGGMERFDPEEYDAILGKYIDLNKYK